MPDVTIVYWRDMPAQVIVGKGRRGSKAPLPERFEQAIDRAAMKAILEKRLGRLRQESSDPRRDPRERASLREAATRYEALLREFE